MLNRGFIRLYCLCFVFFNSDKKNKMSFVSPSASSSHPPVLELGDPKQLLDVQYNIDFLIKKKNKKSALDLINADV